MNPFNILKIPENSTEDQIKKAYKKLAAKWHPDKNPNNIKLANLKFKEISNAYRSLTDENYYHEDLFDNVFNVNSFGDELYFDTRTISDLGKGYRLYTRG